MPRPILATIHTAALANNLEVARRRAPHAKVWAIVKANAYGHGIERAFSGLRDADGFGLLDLNEAVRLRELGWAGPILLLEGFFEPADLAVIDRYALTTTVHCDEQLRMLETVRASRPFSQPLNIQLKMNTGMNRLGFAPARFRTAWERARAIQGIGQIVLMTHFSDAIPNAALTISSKRSSVAHETYRASVAWPIRPVRCITRIRTANGYGPASCCMAGHPRGLPILPKGSACSRP